MISRYIVILMFFSISIVAQQKEEVEPVEKTGSVTIGFLNGGGALIGADFEKLIHDRFGIQVGIGLAAYGFGLNYHFRPKIRSSFISLQYWNQGFGSSFVQNLAGINYVYRGKKWLSLQIGLGIPISQGPAYPSQFEIAPVILMYAVGFYIPI